MVRIHYLFYYFSVLEHPDKNEKMHFEILMYIFLAYIVLMSPHVLLPRWGLMASCPRIFYILPISAVKKFTFFCFATFFLIWT